MNRASFVRTSTATAAAVTFLKNVALGSEASAYTAVMTPLVETILPVGKPNFSNAAASSLANRIRNIFGLDKDAVFLASLSAFSDVSDFAIGSPQLIKAELVTMGSLNIPDLLDRDSSALRNSGLSTSPTFASLSTDDRRIYLRLWEHSAFNTRRRFYGSVRAVTFAAFYSMAESWPVIGYEGPLLKKLS